MPVVCAHELFSAGGSKGEDKNRFHAAVNAFLACSSEVIAFVEQRHLDRRRLQREVMFQPTGTGYTAAWSDVGVPYKQTDDSVGGVAMKSLKSQASWKAWLCQLVKNLEWAVGAASCLCVT